MTSFAREIRAAKFCLLNSSSNASFQSVISYHEARILSPVGYKKGVHTRLPDYQHLTLSHINLFLDMSTNNTTEPSYVPFTLFGDVASDILVV